MNTRFLGSKTANIAVATGLLFLMELSAIEKRHVEIRASLTDSGAVKINMDISSLTIADQLILYRSTTDLGAMKNPDEMMVQYPITASHIQPAKFYMDDQVAHNTAYCYRLKLKAKNEYWSNIVRVITPNIELPQIDEPVLWIDKKQYLLELRDGDAVVKRYPVALGQNPVNRKLHVDYASTPEGIFNIYNLQPSATYYRAYDIDYPTEIDWSRYSYHKSKDILPKDRGANPGIGGEIQIHGLGIDSNWTWGCIALRNDDMDELFNHKEINAGTKVIITGNEIHEKDIASIIEHKDVKKVKNIQRFLRAEGYNPGAVDGVIGPRVRRALCAFQDDNGLPITCEMDSRTINKIQNKQNE